MAKKVGLLPKWKPTQQIKLPEKETRMKSKFYFPSPDKEDDDVFMQKSPITRRHTSKPTFDNCLEFEDARDKFFRKYNIPDEGKTEFAEIFMNREREPRKAKSKRIPLYSTSFVSMTSSPRYKETRMSLPSLSTSTATPSPLHYQNSRKASEGAIETFQSCTTSYQSWKHADANPVSDDSCIFHHRCRSTSLDQPLNQFQISVGGSSTIVIADSNTIILHGQNAELVSQHQIPPLGERHKRVMELAMEKNSEESMGRQLMEIALKLFFNMKDEIITRMVNANFLKELGELMLEKGATPLEIGNGSVELWLSFARADALNEFMEGFNKGKLRDELAQLLLRHGYIKDDKELTISIKDKKVQKSPEIRKGTECDVVVNKDMNGGALEPINFMMSAFGCTNLEQLDTILSHTYERRIPVGGFTGLSTSGNTSSSQVNRDVPASNTLFPTLLHFAAFHGLPKLCACLMDTPGFSHAVSMTNKDGLTPVEMVPVDKPNIRNMLDR